VTSRIRTALSPRHRIGYAGHGFSCDARGSYHEPSARLACERTLAFFRQCVGQGDRIEMDLPVVDGITGRRLL
jgi:hypothetical protein